MYVSLQEWGMDVKKALISKETNLKSVSEEIGCSYSVVTALLSGRIIKGNYLDIAKKINKTLGIQTLPERPPLPSGKWCGAVRAQLYMTKMSIGKLSEKAGFNRDRVSLVLNGHAMDKPVIEKINEILRIDEPVV